MQLLPELLPAGSGAAHDRQTIVLPCRDHPGASEVLVGLGRRGAVTGQEDLALELAGELAGARTGGA